MSLGVRRGCGAALAVTSWMSLWTLTGCVNLDDVCGLTKLAERAEKTLPAISDDFAATCLRRIVYFADIPSGEKAAGDSATDCAPYEAVSKHLKKDEKVLTDYFEALGKLASNTPLAYDAAIDADVTAIGANTSLGADTVKASTAADTIVKALADAATQGYRERKVNEIIKANDAAVQELVGALKRVMTRDYPILLGNEETYMDNYYQGPMLAQHGERLALILVQRQYAGDRAALQKRKDAVKEYGKVMEDIAKLHGKLKQEADAKASMVQIAKEVGPTVSALKDSISNLEAGAK